MRDPHTQRPAEQPHELSPAQEQQRKLEKAKIKPMNSQTFHRRMYDRMLEDLQWKQHRFRPFTGYGIFSDGANHRDRQHMRMMIGADLQKKFEADRQQGNTEKAKHKSE